MSEYTGVEPQTEVKVPTVSIDLLKLVLENEGLDGISKLFGRKGFRPETINAYLTSDPKSRTLEFGTPSEATPENFLATLTSKAEREMKRARQGFDAARKARIKHDPIKDTRSPTQMEKREKDAEDWYQKRYREYARLVRVGAQYEKGNGAPLRDEVNFYQGFALHSLSMTMDNLDQDIQSSILKPEQLEDLQIGPNLPRGYSSDQSYVAGSVARALDLATNWMIFKRVESQLKPPSAIQNPA